jgi:apolipoprotein N-acyltransferase
MHEKTVLLVTGLLMLAAVLIPVPRRTRAILWCVMLGVIVTLWVGVSLGYFAPML